MGFILFFSLIILAIIFPKSKSLSFIIILFIFTLFGLNTATPDYSNYEFMYTNINTGLFELNEPGYVFLCSFCNRLGLTFHEFRMVIAVIFCLCLYLSVKKFTQYRAIALAVSLIFPVLSFVSGIRAALAGSIILYALSCYIYSARRNTLKFILGILLATTIHYSSIMFLFILFEKITISRKKIVFVSASLSLGILVFVYSGLAYDFLKLITDYDKALNWFNPSRFAQMSELGFFAIVFIVFSVIILARLSKKSWNNHFQNTAIPQTVRIKTVDIGERVGFWLIMLLPFFLLNSTFLRLIYELYIFFICSAAESLFIVRRRTINKYSNIKPLLPLLFVFVLSVALLLYENYSFISSTKYTVFDALVNNSFLGKYTL